jgi:hypothetical protein
VRGGVGYAIPCPLAIAKICAKHKPSAYPSHPKGYAVMTEHFNSADKNLQTWVEKAKDPIDKLFREKEALAVLASKEDLKASEADFQKLLVTPEMLATKYGARAAIRRKLMEPVDALVDKAIEHIEAH